MKRLAFIAALLCWAFPIWGARPYGYVVSFGAFYDQGSVSIVNYKTHELVKTLSLGRFPIDAVASPDGKFVYVIDSGLEYTETLNYWVIRTDTNTICATLSLPLTSPYNAQHVAITPDGKYLWIIGTYLYVVDTATNTLVQQVSLPTEFGAYYQKVVFSPDGRLAYISGQDASGLGQVLIVCGITRTTLAVLTGFGLDVPGIALTPDGKFLYVVDRAKPYSLDESGSISVVCVATRKVVDTIPLQTPSSVAISPDGRYAWVSLYNRLHGLADHIAVIETATNNVITTLPTLIQGNYGQDMIAFTPNGRYLLAPGGTGSSTITEYSVPAGSPSYSVGVDTSPVSVAFLRCGRGRR